MNTPLTAKQLIVILVVLGAIAAIIVAHAHTSASLSRSSRAADCQLRYLNAPAYQERACERGDLP